MKKVFSLLLCAMLALSLLAACGAGSEPDAPVLPQQPETPQTDDKSPIFPEVKPAEPEAEAPAAPVPEAPVQVIDPDTGKDAFQTDPVPEDKPVPVEPQQTEVTEKELTCTLSVSCATILDHTDQLDPDKAELVPADGVILASTEVTFREGQSIFDILQKALQERKLHLEFSMTPMYNSAYIEGIGNLYEFDCGELSGWMYKVDGWFPNYGSSRYVPKGGETVEWLYTCDLGADIGGAGITQQ